MMNLTFQQWLRLKVLGEVYVYHATKKGWKGQLPFYIVRCSRHGIYYLDYLHGFEGYNEGFDCPFCLQEVSAKVKNTNPKNTD